MSAPRVSMGVTSALLAVAAAVLVSGCGSSPDAVSTTTAKKDAAAVPNPSGTCPGNPDELPYALDFVNAGAREVVRVTFSGVECPEWTGRTPMAYGPLNVSGGDSTRIKVDPSCVRAPSVFTATLAAPGGDDPSQVASVDLLVANGRCNGDASILQIWDGGWKNAARISIGGSSWSVSASTSWNDLATLTMRPS